MLLHMSLRIQPRLYCHNVTNQTPWRGYEQNLETVQNC